jgi:hypothetical protein
MSERGACEQIVTKRGYFTVVPMTAACGKRAYGRVEREVNGHLTLAWRCPTHGGPLEHEAARG